MPNAARSVCAVALLVNLGFVLACSSILNPAGAKLAEAEALAAAGDFEGASAKYDEVTVGYPDHPEAKLVPGSVKRTFTEGVVREVEAQHYDKAGVAAKHLVQSFPEEWKDFVPAAAMAGAALGIHMAAPISDDTLPQLLVAHPVGSAQTQADIQAWVCKHADALPQIAACLHGDGVGCRAVAPMATWCPDNDLTPAVTKWQTEAKHQADAALAQLDALHQGCATAKERVQQIQDKYMVGVLSGSMQASAQLLMEERPHNQRISDGGEEVTKIKDNARTLGWPEQLVAEVESKADASACGW